MSGQTVKSGRVVRIPDKNGQFCGHVSGQKGFDRRKFSTDLYGYYGVLLHVTQPLGAESHAPTPL